jgi:UDP-3-O-[3-hydroxymyristoyl] N-acetylglucosamine deacetylase
MSFQRTTIASPVRVEGVGLFTGSASAVTIEPAELSIAAHNTPPHGIVFVSEGETIPAVIANLSATPAHPAFAELPPRNTAVERAGAVVQTTEHILAALAGLGVTDAVVRVEGGEIPIGNGSADLFVRPILEAGLITLDDAEPIEPIRVRAPIRVERDGASVTIEPSDRPEYVYRLDYGPASPIPAGEAIWEGDADAFARTVAPARTFCLQSEAEMLVSLGLFEGLSPTDMLVFGPGGPVENKLRFPDEPARHKLLDLIGDLSLVGRPICARVIAERSGHALNHEAARRLVAAIEA